MSDLTLVAETGRPQGSSSSRRVRAEGKVPAVVYGLGGDPVPIAVEWPDLRRVLTTEAGMNALIQLEVEGDTQLALIKELQRHPVRRNVLHVDFIRLDADTEVEVEVRIVLVGEAKEVYDNDGMVDQTMFSLTVLSRPDAIPNEIEVDISELQIGTALHVSALSLPTGVRTEVDPEATIAAGTVTRSTLEAIADDEAAAEAAEEAAEEAETGGDAEASADAGDSDEGDSE